VFLAVSTGLWLIFCVLAGAMSASAERRIVRARGGSILGAGIGLTSGLVALILRANLDVPTWHDARPVGWGLIVLLLLGMFLTGAVGWLIGNLGPDVPVPAAGRVPGRKLAAGERPVWIGYVPNRWLVLIGALLAVVLARLRADDPRLALLGRWAGRLCWPALALLALVAWQIPIADTSAWNPVWYTAGFMVAAVLTATVVAALDQLPDSWPSRLLSIGALTWVGRNLSYGMYLWHYPVIRLLSDLGVPDDQLLPMGMVATVVAALASYALVERPLLRRG
jgi:hypothetical protein